MRVGVTRLLTVAACVVWLAGCESTSQLNDATGSLGDSALASSAPNGAGAELLGNDPKDDLSLGKRHYKEQNYGLAEKHFRKAVEAQPRTAEAWVGLAASYDRLRRFDLADRAYEQAITLLGPTPEVLNNQGFSYMLRGDYRRAHAKFMAAKARDPANPHVHANLKLLRDSVRQGKAIE